MINKTHSKQELVEVINELNLKIVHSHQDNKRDIQEKILQLLKDNKKLEIKDNFYGINDRNDFVCFLQNPNPKKSLNIKEKNALMSICKSIIHYSKNDFDLSATEFNSIQEIIDDMDYLKQFGDIPSVRRCCRLLMNDPKIKQNFIPLISPNIQKNLNEKDKKKQVILPKLVIRYSTPENPIILKFD